MRSISEQKRTKNILSIYRQFNKLHLSGLSCPSILPSSFPISWMAELKRLVYAIIALFSTEFVPLTSSTDFPHINYRESWKNFFPY